MKSLRNPILAGLAVAILASLGVVVYDQVVRVNTERSLQDFLNDISLPLLEQGDPLQLFSHLDEGVDLISPDMGFIRRYLPLMTLSEWEGEIAVPSLFATVTPSAVVSTRAHYAKGVADLRAAAVYEGGQWRIRQFEVIPGPAAQ